MRNTSIDAYHKIELSGKANTQKHLIVNYLKEHNGKATRRQIARDLQLETSTVSARVNSLKNDHHTVTDEKTIKCPISNKTVTLVELVA